MIPPTLIYCHLYSYCGYFIDFQTRTVNNKRGRGWTGHSLKTKLLKIWKKYSLYKQGGDSYCICFAKLMCVYLSVYLTSINKTNYSILFCFFEMSSGLGLRVCSREPTDKTKTLVQTQTRPLGFQKLLIMLRWTCLHCTKNTGFTESNWALACVPSTVTAEFQSIFSWLSWSLIK